MENFVLREKLAIFAKKLQVLVKNWPYTKKTAPGLLSKLVWPCLPDNFSGEKNAIVQICTSSAVTANQNRELLSRADLICLHQKNRKKRKRMPALGLGKEGADCHKSNYKYFQTVYHLLCHSSIASYRCRNTRRELETLVRVINPSWTGYLFWLKQQPVSLDQPTL